LIHYCIRYTLGNLVLFGIHKIAGRDCPRTRLKLYYQRLRFWFIDIDIWRVTSCVIRTCFGERAFCFAGLKSWNDLPSLVLRLRTPSNSNLRPIFLIRSLSLQFNFILVYYEMTVLLRWWTFYWNWHTTSFYCIVLYCIVLIIIYISWTYHRKYLNSKWTQYNVDAVIDSICTRVTDVNKFMNKFMVHTDIVNIDNLIKTLLLTTINYVTQYKCSIKCAVWTSEPLSLCTHRKETCVRGSHNNW